MYWGGYGTDISGKSDGLGRGNSITNGLLNYQKVITTPDATSKEGTALSSSYYAYIPRQAAIGGTPTRNNSPYAPSPYNGDDYMSGGYNSSYGTTAYDAGETSLNALADFKGIVNTKIITDLATSELWKTLPSITNNSGEGYYPAACCCARYHTIGTKAFKDCTATELKKGTGFWYLPACGELGYIIPRLFDINNTISQLNTAYGVGVQLGTGNYFWSSSEYNNNYARYVGSSNGRVSYYIKDDNYRVRAFLRL